MGKTSPRLLSHRRRRVRVRKKIRGTNERPRLCVYRSSRYIYAQLISDETGSVLGAASTRKLELDNASPGSTAGAKVLGTKIAEIAKEKSISTVVFDRNGYLYHGRVAAVAEGAREAGLEF